MSEEQTKNTCQEGLMSLGQANNDLAVHLHRLLAEEKQNVFFSPFSISTAMAMLLCASEGKTASEMMSTLGYDSAGIKKKDIADMFEKQMSVLLNTPTSYTLNCANSMLTQKGFNVKDEYKQILSESFKALLLEMDLSNIKEATKHINDWVKEKTNNMIPKFIENLNPGAVLVLLNAVYFKGTWSQKFSEKLTKSQKFYNKGVKSKNVAMMHLKESFPFYEDQKIQVLQLPYVGEEVAMMILLPRAKDGLESLEANFSMTFIQDIMMHKLWKQKVEVSMPRFRLEYSKSLIPCFKSLGIKQVFVSADLSVATGAKGLFVSEIFHKAVVEVNEEGSEAAAATMIVVGRCAPRPVPTFVADHPFAFIIYNTASNLILFMGRVNEL